MENKLTKFRVAGIALMVAMLMALACLFAGLSLAQEPEGTDDGVANEDLYIEVTSTTTTGKLTASDGTTTYENTNWNADDKVLTLSGATISDIITLKINDTNLTDVAIVLEGENTLATVPSVSGELKADASLFINSATNVTIKGTGILNINSYDPPEDKKNIKGIQCTKSKLNIDGAKLNIVTKNSATNVNYGIEAKNLAISNSADVHITYGYSCNTGSANSAGIFANEGATILNSKVTIVSGPAPASIAQIRSCGIWCQGDLTISGIGCEVSVASGQSPRKSYGVWLNKQDTKLALDFQAKLTATSNYADDDTYGVVLDGAHLTLNNGSELNASNSLEGYSGGSLPKNSYGLYVIGAGTINTNDSTLNAHAGKASSDAYGIYNLTGDTNYKNSTLCVDTEKSDGNCRCISSQGNVTFDSSAVNLTAGAANDISECVIMTKGSGTLNFINSNAVLAASDAGKTSIGILSRGTEVNITSDTKLLVTTGDVNVEEESKSIGIASDSKGNPTLTINSGAQVVIKTGMSLGYSDGIYFNNNITIDGEETYIWVDAGPAGDSSFGICLDADDQATGTPAITISGFASVDTNAALAKNEAGIFANNGNIKLNDGLNVASYVVPNDSAEYICNIAVEKDTANTGDVAIIIDKPNINALLNCVTTYDDSGKMIGICYLDPEHPCYLFYSLVLTDEADAKAEDGTWYWDSTALTLTLNNANIKDYGTIDFALDSDKTATIIVNEGTDNNISSLYTVAATDPVYTSCNLNIVGGGTLNIDATGGDEDADLKTAINATSTDEEPLNFTLADNVKLNIKVGSTVQSEDSSCAGLFIIGDANIKDNAKLTVNTGSSVVSASVLAWGDVNISGNPELALSTDNSVAAQKAAWSIKAGGINSQETNAQQNNANNDSDYKINFVDGIENYTITNCAETEINQEMKQADYSSPLTVVHNAPNPGPQEDSTAGGTATGDFNLLWLLLVVIAAGAATVGGRYAYKKYVVKR